MNTSIQMGNDEFILYIRKNHPDCAISNDDLGKKIWKWINESDADVKAEKVRDDEACLWGKDAANIGETKLPKTAAQFRFESTLLPSLYEHLDALGKGE